MAVVWWHVISMDFLEQTCVLEQLMTICDTVPRDSEPTYSSEYSDCDNE